jgi:hypothetical protein
MPPKGSLVAVVGAALSSATLRGAALSSPS